MSPPAAQLQPRSGGSTAPKANGQNMAARTVDWWSVHTYVLPLLTSVGTWPMAGSIAWLALGDSDPAKLAAIFDAARHHALRVDTAQTSLADASHAIAGVADWAAIAGRVT